MKRIVLDVPKWHAYLHRDARGLEIATERDGPVRKLEDELFDLLYSGDTERLPEKEQDPKLRTWADGIHQSCEQLPAFGRLVAECRGDAMAAGTAVETLTANLRPDHHLSTTTRRRGSQGPPGADLETPARRPRRRSRSCARRWRGWSGSDSG